MRNENSVIEGRNAVLEALRSDQTVDRLFIIEDNNDGPIRTILREAKKQHLMVEFCKKERLDQMSVTGKHQGAIAYIAAYEYFSVDDILNVAKEKRRSFYFYFGRY